MFCADIIGNVHWLGGEAAEPGSVPSAVTGLWDQVSRGVSWQPEHPAVSFAGREGACSCCLPGSNKEAPVWKGGLAGILLMSAKEAKEPLLGKNIVLARHSKACVYSFGTPCRQQVCRAARCQPCCQPWQQLRSITGNITRGLCMVILLTYRFSKSLDLAACLSCSTFFLLAA